MGKHREKRVFSQKKSDANKKVWANPEMREKKHKSLKKAAEKRKKPEEQLKKEGWVRFLKNTYGITPEQYNEFLVKQDGKCPVCHNQLPLKSVIDHNHETGEVRGILCIGCNLIVGTVEKRKKLIEGSVLYLFQKGAGTNREKFATGSQRDTRVGKGRFDLISPIGMKRLALVYERGAMVYASRNWERGQPISRYLDSAYRHLQSAIMGMEDEDHLAQLAWNAFAAMHTEEMVKRGSLSQEFMDLPKYGFSINDIKPPEKDNKSEKA